PRRNSEGVVDLRSSRKGTLRSLGDARRRAKLHRTDHLPRDGAGIKRCKPTMPKALSKARRFLATQTRPCEEPFRSSHRRCRFFAQSIPEAYIGSSSHMIRTSPGRAKGY